MATPLYGIDVTDQFNPQITMLPYDPGKIGLVEDPEGMEFGVAKEELIKIIRHHRDHWDVMLRNAKKLTKEDVKTHA